MAAGAAGPPVNGSPRYLAEHPRFVAWSLTLGAVLLCGGAIAIPNLMHPG